jgi:hypothetical protein
MVSGRINKHESNNTQTNNQGSCSTRQQVDRREKMSVQPAQSTRRSPPSVDASPPRIGDAAVQAVHKLGAVTSNEIDKTADEIMRGATEIAARLGQLADAIRGHCQIAGEEVADFCGRATSVFESVIALQGSLLPNGARVGAESADDARSKAKKSRTDRALP